jgi:hypothetical protein
MFLPAVIFFSPDWQAWLFSYYTAAPPVSSSCAISPALGLDLWHFHERCPRRKKQAEFACWALEPMPLRG